VGRRESEKKDVYGMESVHVGEKRQSDEKLGYVVDNDPLAFGEREKKPGV